MKLIKDFKKFAFKENILEMAIGIIIGASFGKVVSSLADNLLTPFLNILISDIHFTNYKYVLNDPLVHGQAIAFNYGIFLQNLFSFLVVSIAVFILIKGLGIFKKKEDKKDEEISNEEKLLVEIRDLLKENNAAIIKSKTHLNTSPTNAKTQKAENNL